MSEKDSRRAHPVGVAYLSLAVLSAAIEAWNVRQVAEKIYTRGRDEGFGRGGAVLITLLGCGVAVVFLSALWPVRLASGVHRLRLHGHRSRSTVSPRPMTGRGIRGVKRRPVEWSSTRDVLHKLSVQYSEEYAAFLIDAVGQCSTDMDGAVSALECAETILTQRGFDRASAKEMVISHSRNLHAAIEIDSSPDSDGDIVVDLDSLYLGARAESQE
ncbi:hypothetical protein ACFYTQ_28315 [Nocardia sp. NPDC004068]|uniref:hypothetical protein n=1 Tax=Nocardia sp. NPDC004068 TaxID=3364303 RepID=UPI0036B81702